ncbi:MAG TPA: EVE domain-containing protein [Dehalococcoidia bacterium]|nr:EVE domain-containing protein [Dehalococcoidia bacterium]
MAQEIDGSRSYWSFRANPTLYRIEEELRTRATPTWTTKRSKVKAGDRAVIWKTKGRTSDYGIVALADILSDPELGAAGPDALWVDPSDGRRIENRVQLRYLLPTGVPLWVGGPYSHLLEELTVYRSQGGTVNHVSPEQWSAILEAVGGWPNDVPQVPTDYIAPVWTKDRLEWIYEDDEWSVPVPEIVTYLATKADALVLEQELADAVRPESDAQERKAKLRGALANLTIRAKDHGIPGAGQVWRFYNSQGEPVRLWPFRGSGGPGYVMPAEIAAIVNEIHPTQGVTEQASLYPDELVQPGRYPEGARRQVFVNAYERSTEARRQCIKRYGFSCWACGMSFESVYGDLGKDFIHVHHLRSLAELGEEYEVDPIEDLRPVCPNCHAMLHRSSPALSIEDLRARLS